MAYASICSRIQAITGKDIGVRGMAKLFVEGDLERAGALFASSTATVVLTGFPCRITSVPPTETDGPSGAAALALAAHRLGAKSAIAIDDSSEAVLAACAKAVSLSPASSPPFEVLSFPPRSGWTAGHTARLVDSARAYPHAVAVERAGVAIDGTYRTMRAKVMDDFVAPLDVLLTAGTTSGRGAAVPPLAQEAGATVSAVQQGHASAHEAASSIVPGLAELERGGQAVYPSRTSTGIGDGGNECGMGKVADRVREHINNGQVIAAVTPADALVAAGVSNWGAWAVVAAAEAAVRCALAGRLPSDLPAPSQAALAAVRAQQPGFLLPSRPEEESLSRAMCDAGAGDGITGATDGSVDGMPLATHLDVLEQVRAVLQQAFGEV